MTTRPRGGDLKSLSAGNETSAAARGHDPLAPAAADELGGASTFAVASPPPGASLPNYLQHPGPLRGQRRGLGRAGLPPARLGAHHRHLGLRPRASQTSRGRRRNGAQRRRGTSQRRRPPWQGTHRTLNRGRVDCRRRRGAQRGTSRPVLKACADLKIATDAIGPRHLANRPQIVSGTQAVAEAVYAWRKGGAS